MLLCPACSDVALVDFLVDARVSVELCPSCKGLLLDAEELEPLTGGGFDPELTSSPFAAALPPLSTDPGSSSLRCPRCEAGRLAPLWYGGEILLWSCADCSVYWLRAGAIERIRRLSRRERPEVPRDANAPDEGAPAPPPSASPFELRLGPVASELALRLSSAVAELPQALRAPAPLPTAHLVHARSRFDSGSTLYGAPLALVLAWLFCSTRFGEFLARLVAMPFHELGHATASWLTARFAVPLPFFTIWSNEQSWFVGCAVAFFLIGFAWLSHREGRRWGVVLGGALLAAELVLSGFLSARSSLFVQIASGALGEIFFGALLLVTFHFPLPDGLRWDFWRWPALAPGALSLAQALRLWSEARRDASHMPWGSALGNDADGDMNRLVHHFGWSAQELTRFYWWSACLGLFAVAFAWGLSWHRLRRRPHDSAPSDPPRSGSTPSASARSSPAQRGSAAGGPT